MDLTGTALLVASGLAVVLSVAVTLATWTRVRGAGPVRGLQRIGLLMVCQLTAVVLAAVLVNDDLALYTSWGDLVGTDVTGAVQADPVGAPPTGSASGGGTATRAADPRGVTTTQPLPGSGRLREETVTGATSRVTARVWILLPAGYDQAGSTRRYPVVEFLPGFPGTPTTWLRALQLQTVMDAEVAAGRVRPFIAVLPTMNVASPRDTECVDVAHGPQVATWLATDVPAIVGHQVRALPTGADWSLVGYSTGGFCAVKLAMTHPATFHSAVVLSGYFSPSSSAGLGDLFGGDQDARRRNDPMWLLGHRPAPPIAVLAIASDQDPSTAQPTRAFLAAVRPPMRAAQLLLTTGGHNTGVWTSVEPQLLQWLSHQWQP